MSSEPGDLERPSRQRSAATGGGATDELLPRVYDELRRLAASMMRGERRHVTPTPGDLVHEAYLRLLGPGEPAWRSRGHFFGAAAQAMRRILVERARYYAAAKHGGELERITLVSSVAPVELSPEEFLDLDRALDRLEEKDRRMAAVAKLRYFAGLSVEETARALDVSPRSVDRYWTSARTWLHRELSSGPPGPAA